MDRTVPIACLCPPKADGTPRHEGDTVTLRERLSFAQALQARNAVRLLYDGDLVPSEAEITAVLTEQYLMVGVESWTLQDADGKPLPVSRANLVNVLMADDVAAEDVGDVADDLYSEKVVLPLGVRASRYLRTTQTPDSTSPPTGSSTEPPTPSSPSSITSIPTASTGRTSKSRGGGSSSSRSSVSAA